MTPYDLRGKVVLVTGPARGIGAELARRLAARGATLALVGLEPDRLAALAAETGGAWFEADVADGAAVDAAVAAAVERFGGIDVAVANAGITAFGPLAGLDVERFEAVVRVNLLGAYRTLRACAPHVCARRGYLLVVSSMAAAIHSPMQAHYAASKAGVAALADCFRLEVAPYGARVGVAHPTFVETDLMVQTRADAIGGRLWLGHRWPWTTISLDEAVTALEGAIVRRARRVVVPRRLTPVVLAPGVFQPVAELFFRPGRVRRLARGGDR